MRERYVIDTQGKAIPLREWQKLYNISISKVSKCFDLTNPVLFNQTYFFEPLLLFLDRLASKDIILTNIVGQRLHRENFQYCSTEGMSVWIDYAGKGKRRFFYKNLLNTLAECKELEPKLSLRCCFHREYNGQLYIDIAPMYYGYGRPYANKEHHEDLEQEQFQGIPEFFRIEYECRLEGVNNSTEIWQRYIYARDTRITIQAQLQTK